MVIVPRKFKLVSANLQYASADRISRKRRRKVICRLRKVIQKNFEEQEKDHSCMPSMVAVYC